MKKYYLTFEKPLKDLDQDIENLISIDSESDKLNQLKAERGQKEKEIFSELGAWETVQIARHPNRPYTLDYIDAWCDDFIELHGDKAFADDHAVMGGLARLGDRVAIIGQQKGRNTKENLYRNFGMMKPEGYRKALRVMKIAEKFHLPIVTLIDTPGADPGIAAEERGQGFAIANNLIEMASIDTQILSVVIGEGASGGALGIGLCDKMLMLENTWYSVISPEGCASILWKDSKKAEQAADALCITAPKLVKFNLVDMIIPEPLGGAHSHFDETLLIVKNAVIDEIDSFKKDDSMTYLDSRVARYNKLGVFREF